MGVVKSQTDIPRRGVRQGFRPPSSGATRRVSGSPLGWVELPDLQLDPPIRRGDRRAARAPRVKSCQRRRPSWALTMGDSGGRPGAIWDQFEANSGPLDRGRLMIRP
jgi:hypothetical protein